MKTFEKFLALWVALCMAAGVLLSRTIPGLGEAIDSWQVHGISIPIGICLFLMMYPALLNLQVAELKKLRRNPRPILLTLLSNWIVAPLLAAALARLFLRGHEQLTVAVILLGSSPCTAMVLVWGYLARGNDGLTLVMVAINSLTMLVLYGVLGGFLRDVMRLNDAQQNFRVMGPDETVSNRLAKFAKELKANPKLKPVGDTYQHVQALLDSGAPVWSDATIDREHIADLHLLTAKPIIYLFNVDEVKLTDENEQSRMQSLVAPAPALFVNAKLESELRTLDEADAAEMLESYGVAESGLIKLIHAAYELLGLQSYLTAGDKEVRAWTIPRGATAPQAAGVIHGDFERGFIAADIVSCPDLLAAGSLAAARGVGKVRTEGKTYIMQPDDVVEFKFNVFSDVNHFLFRNLVGGIQTISCAARFFFE